MDDDVNPVKRHFQTFGIAHIANEESQVIQVAEFLLHLELFEFVTGKNHQLLRFDFVIDQIAQEGLAESPGAACYQN